ncbi:ATP-binding protein [Nitratifractor sp.]
MLKLSQLFFRRSAALFVGAFLVAALLGYLLLRQMEIHTHETMLRKMISILADELRSAPASRIPAIVKRVHDKTGVRVTVIAPDGRVLYESDRSPVGMENHATRPEVLEAKEKGWGSAVRHSATLDEDLLYVARRTPEFTLRMAYSLAEIRRQLLILWLKSLLFFAGVLGALFWLGGRLSRQIDRDTGRIRDSLERILEKRYDDDFAWVECCREFAEIRRLVGKVSKKLAKRERQKAKYTRKLKEHAKRQSDIISAISHEFKNPVAAILGYAQSLEEMEGLDPALRKRFIAKIGENASRISQMIDRLALAIKLENRTFTPKRTTFPLASVAENVREMLSQKYPGRSIGLECADVTIHADRDMIEHVLINLVENALKYSEEEVTIRCTPDRLEVIDRGEGIDGGEIEKITKKFYRVDRLSWNNSIGVGLYIVKFILKLHGISLEIESRPGEGSVFGFSLEGLQKEEVRGKS